MRDEPTECSEESLSGLVDDELEPAEKRAVAVHALACPECSRKLGELYATRAALTVPQPARVKPPRSFWRGVREGMDRVDGLIRATNHSPRRRPLVSPFVVAAGLVLIICAVVAKAFLFPGTDMADQLSRLHLNVALGPDDPGLHQAVGLGMVSVWQPVSQAVEKADGVMVLQTVYNVNGLAVSVFRLPANHMDVTRLAPVRIGDRMFYVAAFDNSSLAATREDGSWDVVVARTPPEYVLGLAMSCPRDAGAMPGM